jgi:thiamine-phosphate pyrophosphorylase
MFAYKKKYFLIIESIRDLNLNNIKKYNKFLIIYRREGKKENINDLLLFRKKCRLKLIDFYVANDMRLVVKLKADGIYLSSHNKSLKTNTRGKLNFKIIGSAHNVKEISFKKKQGCNYILFSKLFLVDYDKLAPYMGIVKFNKFTNIFSKKLVPLGGIKTSNLNYLKNVNCEAIAILSEIKKKPIEIINRLF